MATCRAAVVNAYGERLELRDIPIPVVDRGGVLVRVEAATLCGTDAHRWAGERPSIRPPFIPGHETCGIVAEFAGSPRDVFGRPLALGDRILSCYPYCGQCYHCTVTRQTWLCPETIYYGSANPARLMGGCAEYHYFPPGAQYITVPAGVSSALAASAACALRTIMHAFERLGPIAAHETVAVQGAGPLGLYAAVVARASGAGKVLVIGAPRKRLEIAQRWGADDVLDLEGARSPAARVEWIRKHTTGRGADVVLQCASMFAMPEALEMAVRGGRVMAIGNSTGAPVSIPQEAFFKGLTISNVIAGEERHFVDALGFLDRQRTVFDFGLLVAQTYGLDEVSDALAAMEQLRAVKPVVVP